MQSKRLVHEFMKNATEKIRVELSEFQGVDLIDIRAYYNAGLSNEYWKPTKKGISIRSDLIPQLKEAIDKAYQEWEGKNTTSN